MLASTLLIVFLLSASSVFSIEDEQQSGICGCPSETIESFYEDRIPSKIVEQVCHQVGITCGASLEHAPVSAVSNNFSSTTAQYTVFENHRKSLIQHCEWTKVN